MSVWTISIRFDTVTIWRPLEEGSYRGATRCAFRYRADKRFGLKYEARYAVIQRPTRFSLELELPWPYTSSTIKEMEEALTFVRYTYIFFGVRDNFGYVKRDEWISKGPFVSFQWVVGLESRRAAERIHAIDFGRAAKDSSGHWMKRYGRQQDGHLNHFEYRARRLVMGEMNATVSSSLYFYVGNFHY